MRRRVNGTAPGTEQDRIPEGDDADARPQRAAVQVQRSSSERRIVADLNRAGAKRGAARISVGTIQCQRARAPLDDGTRAGYEVRQADGVGLVERKRSRDDIDIAG